MLSYLSSVPSLAPERDAWGRVHSVYASAINFTLDGKLFCLQRAGTPRSPITFLPDIPTASLPEVARGDTVQWDGVGLRLGRVVLSGAYASRFQSLARPCHIPPNPLSPASQYLVQRCLTLPNPFPGAVLASRPPCTPLEREASAIAQATAEALRAGYLPAAAQAASAMLGLGPGLTPSGDDWLCGLLGLAHISGSPAAARFCGLLARCLLPRLGQTTDLSARFLSLACEGHFCEPLLALFSALDDGDLEALFEAASDVASLGHSSGADLLSGVAFLLRIRWDGLQA